MKTCHEKSFQIDTAEDLSSSPEVVLSSASDDSVVAVVAESSPVTDWVEIKWELLTNSISYETFSNIIKGS